MYTLEDLEKAKERLASLERSWENYSGNNPNKFRTRLRDAHEQVGTIQYYLKASGVIPYSEKELFDRKLDEAFPDVRSKQIVEYEGKLYQRVFIKGSNGWIKNWMEMPSPS